MNVNEVIELMRTAKELGASDFSFDTMKISFKNSYGVKEIDTIPEQSTFDKPNHQEIYNEEITSKESDELLLKAEELALMAIEDPEKFEEILANDSEALREFKDEVEDEL